MKTIWPEEPWEAHGCALGMSAPGQPLEERLAMLGRRGGWSRRRLLGAGLLLAAAAPLALVPWQVSAQERDSDAAQLAQQWEDVLLLDALRYLRMELWQLQEFRTVSRVTDSRLQRLRAEENRVQLSLQRIARKQRESLVAGRSVSLQEQANALLLEKSLKTGRERAAEEILAYALPRVVRVLTPAQKVRAILLTHGETPQNTAKRPALLAPASGFVIEESARYQSWDTAVRSLLSRRYPPSVMEGINQNSTELVLISQIFDHSGKASPVQVDLHPRLSGSIRIAPFAVTPSLPTDESQPQLAAARRDYERLSKWPALAEELARSAAPKDLAEALAFHVRRLFTSPRLKTVLEERLRSGGQTLEDDPEVESKPPD